MGLEYHMEDALKEHNIDTKMATARPRVALFARNYYNEINNLNHEKKHDYCFIGSIKSNARARQWVIQFVKNYFTEKSVFVNTDNPPEWKKLGPFDYTGIIKGFNPKSQVDTQSRETQYRVVDENKEYFETMCQSEYVLCPRGDAPWSFRFYEVLMCKSLPIVESWEHTFRTREEMAIGYRYVLASDAYREIDHDKYVSENTRVFEENI